ncbi:hypothetical protein FisN_17Lh237 [Fistulifera solaris]|uniref:Pentacotripeptide-repeat region of PRORP domain-containing protein n=1 Tax=Fistulifera solaris TaxID=1519565 RepID=A0A1Z5KMZ9_FISSO|nr:hypothetical protein FisN_17Lh237 [Fistulifera solaris]|eukprot:GAX27381.1 hypothetical protein FisN_17Lh237 [Fistulifera solaris]
MRSRIQRVLSSTATTLRIRRLAPQHAPWKSLAGTVHNNNPQRHLQQQPAWYSSSFMDEGNRSAIRKPKVLINDLESSMNKLLATEDPLSPEAWIESEELLSMLLQDKSIRSVVYSFQLLDRLLIDLPSPFGDWINTNLLNRMVGLWRVALWENDIPDYSVSQMLDRVLYYAQHHHLGNEKTLYLIVEAGVRSGKTTPEFAEHVLEKCIDLWQAGKDPFYPTPPLFNIVTRAWMLAQRPESVTRIEAIVQRMVELMIPLNRESYLNMIQALAALESTNAALRCEDILDRMTHAYHAGEITFSSLDGAFGGAFGMTITAWLKSGSSQAGRKAEELLKKMLDFHANHLHEKRDIIPAFNVAIQCQAITGTISGAKKAQEVFNMMRERFTPNYVSYLNLIQAWSIVGQATRVEAIVQQMRTLYENGNEDLRPDSVILTALISAHARSKSPNKVKDNREEAATRAYNLLQELKDAYKNGDESLKPNVVCYNAVMNGLARMKDPYRVSRLLREMFQDYEAGNESAKPDVRSFNILLKAWSLTSDPYKGERAEQILKRMIDLSETGKLDVAPNVISYTTLLTCYGSSNRPKKAEEVFNEMERLHAAGKIGAPTKQTLQLLKRAWLSSREKNKKIRAKAVDREIALRFGSDKEREQLSS